MIGGEKIEKILNLATWWSFSSGTALMRIATSTHNYSKTSLFILANDTSKFSSWSVDWGYYKLIWDIFVYMGDFDQNVKPIKISKKSMLIANNV